MLLPVEKPYKANVNEGQAYYEEKYRLRVIKSLEKRAEQLGYQLTPAMKVG
ncbi:MAG: hypothetical protein GQ529_09530 [Methyloprofundus sp.]|nr:hypothetical protein [Methyloprofundus sp.]